MAKTIMSNDIIETIYGNNSVKGHIVHLTSSDIDVIIDKPFEEISSELHIPYFSRPHNSFCNKDKKINKYGIETAEKLLVRLYEDCRFFEENRKQLVTAYLETDSNQEEFEKTVQERHRVIGIDTLAQLIDKYIKTSS